MVVKPLRLHRTGAGGAWSQPAVKCRGPRVPADHLRPGLHAPEQPGAAAAARPGPQAVAGPAASSPSGVEALERFVRARAAAAGPRVRLRRAGPGERAGRPAALGSSPGVPRGAALGHGRPRPRLDSRDRGRPLDDPDVVDGRSILARAGPLARLIGGVDRLVRAAGRLTAPLQVGPTAGGITSAALLLGCPAGVTRAALLLGCAAGRLTWRCSYFIGAAGRLTWRRRRGTGGDGAAQRLDWRPRGVPFVR